MISLKELNYVDSWARKAPYPGRKYATETLENMKILLEKFNKVYKNKDYSIIFSDSTELNFEIFDYNVCHMLGVDYKNLFEEQYDSFLKNVLSLDKENTKISSFNIINRILENYEEVIKYDESCEYRAINYYKSRIKCTIFEQLNQMDSFNFGKLDTENDSKILYFPSNEIICPYFIARLEKGIDQEKYSISSLLAPKNDEIKPFFKRKSAIPTQIIIDDNNNLHKLEATSKEKLNLFNQYKSIISTYGMENKLDIFGDYISTLATSSIEENRKKEKIKTP